MIIPYIYVYHWIHLVQIICFAISANEITSIKYSKNTKIYKKISHKTNSTYQNYRFKSPSNGFEEKKLYIISITEWNSGSNAV